jgi:hypothetical protein
MDIDYSFERVKEVSNMLFGGTGFFIDRFRCASGMEFSGCTAMEMYSKKHWQWGSR